MCSSKTEETSFYWDSMAEGGDRHNRRLADRANTHMSRGNCRSAAANLASNVWEAADTGTDLIITASDFKDNLVGC